MYIPILLASFGFIGFFIWYLASEDAPSRRMAGLGAIIASLLTCGLALFPLDKAIHLGLDLQGGTEFLLEVQGTNITPAAVDQAASVIRKRLDTLGTREISIQPEGTNRLKIQIPGLQGPERDATRDQITRAAKLELRMVPQNAEEILLAAKANGGKLPFQYATDYEILPMVERDAQDKEIHSQLVVERKVSIQGKHLVTARRSIGQLGQPNVEFQLDNVGAQEMAAMCEQFHGQRMAIILDREVQSAPTLPEDRDRYINDGRGEISGANMTQLECEDLASVMENPLENPVKILDEHSVDASLGADSIRSGLRAGVLALLLVVGFMMIYYRVSGLIAVLALTVNLILLFGLLAQFHFTLTLPGIAGIVLTIGMAVDANVLIYERIRDELAAGKPARSAIDTGFERAFSAIFDSNTTTLIPAIVLAYLGTGPLRGFAVTLALGIIANLFAALVVSRNAFDWILAGTSQPYLSMMQFIKNPKIDFLRLRGMGLVISLVILGAGIVAVKTHGEGLLGVDFKGGDAVTMTYQNKVEIGKLSDALQSQGLRGVNLQYAGGGTPALFLETEKGESDRAVRILNQGFPQAGFVAGATESVGAQVGGEMKEKALTALLLGLFGILVYAAIRFEWSYAIAAAIGQLHDVLIALSVMAALGRELTLPLVGALLTIAGYSINDKIVVFDRIREGAKLREKGSFYQVINRSLNLTLARTIITGFTCLLATFALVLFGGPVIHDFSLTMFIGIMSGIYSSHFISPGIAWWLGKMGSTAPVSRSGEDDGGSGKSNRRSSGNGPTLSDKSGSKPGSTTVAPA
jgi:SecD/SecF fusion protein